MINLCFICETQYHILNVVNYVLYSLVEEIGDCEVVTDIYINAHRRVPDDLVNRLKEKGVFTNVYTYIYKSIEYDKSVNGIVYKLGKFINPKGYVASICDSINIDVEYDYIYVAYHSPFVYAMSLVFKKSKIRFYDDGLGTYSDLIPRFGFLKGKLRFWVMGVKSPWNNIDKVYVNNAKICDFTQAKELVELKTAPQRKKNESIINQIFNYTGASEYEGKRIIYLTQPHDTPLSQQVDKAIYNSIILYSNYIIRVHPEDKRELYEDAIIDQTNSFWELLCQDYVGSDSILIGKFSTAQITPKILYDIEPTIIFTYELYKDELCFSEVEEYSSTVRRIESIYENAKVFCPRSIDELNKDIIDAVACKH